MAERVGGGGDDVDGVGHVASEHVAFDDVATTHAPVEEVWTLLYEPSRMPEWWPGVASVTDARADGFTLFPEGCRTSRCRTRCAATGVA